MHCSLALLLCSVFASPVILSASEARALEPRQPLASDVQALAGEHLQRLIVKFDDEVLARASDTGFLISGSGSDLTSVDELTQWRGLSFSPLIRLPELRLRDLQDRAAERSGFAQPDLAGLVIVQVPGADAHALLEVGELLQDLDAVEFVHLQALRVPPPYDIAPETPSLVVYQTYRDPNPGLNFDAAWEAGARGGGIRLSDCEYGWVDGHEGLNEINLHLEPGQTIRPEVFANGWAEHGTAVMGETSAMVNDYGCSGLVPDADIYTYPEWTVEGGYRRVTSITNAIANSNAGDVVLLEMQTIYYGNNYGPAELDPAVWTVVKVGTDAGVVIVGAAGNGNQDLDSATYDSYLDRGDSGAIIVGAGTSTASHDKLGFSTYGSRVNLQGWGENVFTLGYGWYAAYGNDPLQYYTDGFNGTSSASPLIASACVALQGLSEGIRAVRMSPAELRQLLIDTGIPQGSGGHIGPFPDMVAAIHTLRPWAEVPGDTRAPARQGLVRWLPSSPNPSGRETPLTYRLGVAGEVDIEIYTVTGRLIRRLAVGAFQESGMHRLVWDGWEDDGQRAPAGVYHVLARSAGNTDNCSIVRVR